ncbi:hypothetical protein, partial [Planomonospora algeriensis]
SAPRSRPARPPAGPPAAEAARTAGQLEPVTGEHAIGEHPAGEHVGRVGSAEAAAPLTTTLGLPKRQPKDPRATPRLSPPSQEALTDSGDPAALAEGFEQMRRALSEGYGDSDTDPGGHPQT